MHRRIAAFTIGAVALLGLTACTGSADPSASTSSSRGAGGGDAATDEAGDDGQSTQDACALISETIADATDAFDSAEESTPESVVAAMKSASETLSRVTDEITNDEVAVLLPDLVDMYAQTAEVMEAALVGDTAGLTQLSDLGDEFTDTTARFQELCLS